MSPESDFAIPRILPTDRFSKGRENDAQGKPYRGESVIAAAKRPQMCESNPSIIHYSVWLDWVSRERERIER